MARPVSARQDSRSPASRRLDDFSRTDAARADANALHAAVDHRPDPLKVRLEAARADVVRVAHLPADDGTLSADFAALRHGLILAGPTFFHGVGAPPPPLLLGAFAPRNGSQLPLADALRAQALGRIQEQDDAGWENS